MKRKKRRSRYSMVIVSHNPEKQDKQLYLSSWYFRLLSILVILGLTAGLVFFSVNMIMNGTILQGNKKNLFHNIGSVTPLLPALLPSEMVTENLFPFPMVTHSATPYLTPYERSSAAARRGSCASRRFYCRRTSPSRRFSSAYRRYRKCRSA